MDSERKEHLKQYILACVRDSVLSWNDLASPQVFDKFLKILSWDTRDVLKELGRKGGQGLLGIAGAALLGDRKSVV